MHLAAAGEVFGGVCFSLFLGFFYLFFSNGVLDGIWDCTVSVPENFLSFQMQWAQLSLHCQNSKKKLTECLT